MTQKSFVGIMFILMMLSSTILIVTCKSKKEKPKKTTITEYNYQSNNDDVYNFLSKITYIGIYKPERNIFIIGEHHLKHNQSMSVAGNIALIYQKKNLPVKIYMEGFSRDTFLVVKVPMSDITFNIRGVDSKERFFPEKDSMESRIDYERTVNIFKNGNYPLRLNFSAEDAKRFKNELISKKINIKILKKYYKNIIEPLDKDIADIIKKTPTNEIAIIICGNQHAINFQRVDIGVNVIKLYSQEDDEENYRRMIMYSYLMY